MTEQQFRKALSSFAEDRYLHQTTFGSHDQLIQYREDLPLALEDINRDSDEPIYDEIRVHFHVPIYLESFGVLGTTQNEIVRCLTELKTHQADTDIPLHLEVETYAWNVLPESLRQPRLADGIAQEMTWLAGQLSETLMNMF